MSQISQYPSLPCIKESMSECVMFILIRWQLFKAVLQGYHICMVRMARRAGHPLSDASDVSQPPLYSSNDGHVFIRRSSARI